MNEFFSKSIKFRGFLYGLIALSSIVAFGNVSEACDVTGACAPISVVIITFEVIATIVSILMCISIFMRIEIILNIELISTVFLLAIYVICVSLASSVRQRLEPGMDSFVALCATWFGMILTIILLYLTFAADDTAKLGFKSKRKEIAEEIPEDLMGANGNGDEGDNEA